MNRSHILISRPQLSITGLDTTATIIAYQAGDKTMRENSKWGKIYAQNYAHLICRTQKKPNNLHYQAKNKGGRGDSNPRPPEPQSGALTN